MLISLNSEHLPIYTYATYVCINYQKYVVLNPGGGLVETFVSWTMKCPSPGKFETVFLTVKKCKSPLNSITYPPPPTSHTPDPQKLLSEISTLKINHVSTQTVVLELHVCQKTIANNLQCIKPMFKFNGSSPHKLTAEDKCKRKSLVCQSQKSKEKIL